MNNLETPIFDSFGGNLEEFTPKILPFLTEDFFRNNRLTNKNIKEEYENLSHKAIYEFDYNYPILKLFIYLSIKGDSYSPSKKSLATHVLEQVFDDDGNIVQEDLKLKI